MTEQRREKAEKLKLLLVETSELIEAYTAMACPDCVEVCCKQKHGRYKEGDLRYLGLLGVNAPERDVTRPPEGPCEAMGPQGCVQPRWMRPFRCTWFFCEPLLAAMNSGPPRKARLLSMALHEMSGLFCELRE
jgi:hypothetical protein